MSLQVNLAKKIHKSLVTYLQKNKSYDDKIIPNKEINPVFLIHIGSSINAGGIMHLEYWLNQFIESGHQFLIITRQIETYNAIAKKYPVQSTSLITKPHQIDIIFNKYKDIKAIFYPANTANNINFLRTHGKKHVFLGHGDSDKSSSMNRLFKVYDEIFVAGQAHIDRFENADFNTEGLNFKIIGRPIASERKTHKTNKIERVVYIPTWEGFVSEQNYSSIHLIETIIAEVRKKTDLPIDIKLHPLTGLTNKNNHNIEKRIEDINIENINIHNKNSPLKHILNSNALYICDLSATITECLSVQCPILTYTPSLSARTHSGKYKPEQFTYQYKNMKELSQAIDNALNNDFQKEARALALNYFIDQEASLENAFQKNLDRLKNTNYE